MIEQTTDYSIFKKNNGNRDIIPSNVKKLVASISMKNLLHLRPIIVNENLEILDGQHRLEAAKELNLPIFYEIHNKFEAQDIPILNVQKSWSKIDVLNFYCSQGYMNYIELKRAMSKYSLNFSAAFSIFRDRTILKGLSPGERSNQRLFNTGLYTFPSGEDLKEILEILTKVIIVQDYLAPRIINKGRFIHGTRFMLSLRKCLYIRSLDFNIFMKKLEMRLDLVKPCHSTAAFISMFKSIYNWKNKNPITLEEDLFVIED